MSSTFTYIKLSFLLLISVLCESQVFAQDIYDLENDLFSRLIAYQNIQHQIDSLNQSLESITKKLNNLKKNKSQNEEQILSVMSSSVTLTNKIKSLKEDQIKKGEKITYIRTKLYKLYEAKIDSLKRSDSDNKNQIAAQQILDLTDKKLLVQPKLGILSIDPLRLLNVNIEKSKTLPQKLLKEYFANAITEVDSHLVIINKSIEETDNIILLKEQTEYFVEESSFENETRPMNLFSNTQTTTPDSYGEVTTETDRSNFTDLNTIKNTTLLGANTFATILRQLSEYNSAIRQNLYSRYSDKNANISLEDYLTLLKETKIRLEEYRSVLTKRIKLFNETN